MEHLYSGFDCINVDMGETLRLDKASIFQLAVIPSYSRM
ncbi:hypothetical protein NSP_21870 [Nodularia spumigena CCY9414]|nr:hypothetical protein NSP_21870 [Nodularia spumigena CCY9414]